MPRSSSGAVSSEPSVSPAPSSTNALTERPGRRSSRLKRLVARTSTAAASRNRAASSCVSALQARARPSVPTAFSAPVLNDPVHRGARRGRASRARARRRRRPRGRARATGQHEVHAGDRERLAVEQPVQQRERDQRDERGRRDQEPERAGQHARRGSWRAGAVLPQEARGAALRGPARRPWRGSGAARASGQPSDPWRWNPREA